MIGISKLYCGAVEPSDVLRYNRQSGELPSHLLQFSADKKPVIVWVKEGDKVHRVRVATGAIDGSNAEIKFGLKEGDEVILSMSLASKATAAAAPATTTNPFMPTRPAGGRGR